MKSQKSMTGSTSMLSVAIQNLANMAVVATVAGAVLFCLVVASKAS